MPVVIGVGWDLLRSMNELTEAVRSGESTDSLEEQYRNLLASVPLPEEQRSNESIFQTLKARVMWAECLFIDGRWNESILTLVELRFCVKRWDLYSLRPLLAGRLELDMAWHEYYECRLEEALEHAVLAQLHLHGDERRHQQATWLTGELRRLINEPPPADQTRQEWLEYTVSRSASVR